MPTKTTIEEEWRQVLSQGEAVHRHLYHLMGAMPSSPRCKLCNAPFKGWGGVIMRLTGREPSKNNPRFCNPCDRFAHPGGAEVALTMFFADVRGSTTLAERMSALEFSRLMSRFYAAATDALVKTDALIDKLVGDEVIGLYIPGFAGPAHARRAIEAAQELLRVTGHGEAKTPWAPVGIGVHTGPAFVGVVEGTEGVLRDFTALGDNVNITARLASAAGPGEILISDAAYGASGLDLGALECRQLELKGKSEPTGVHVLRV